MSVFNHVDSSGILPRTLRMQPLPFQHINDLLTRNWTAIVRAEEDAYCLAGMVLILQMDAIGSTITKRWGNIR